MSTPVKSLYELKTEDLGHRLSWLVLTQEQFAKEVGPYLGFTRDQLLDMLSSADDANEGLPISTDRKNYFLPPDEVKAFFKINEKPRRAMSIKEENSLLKRQTAELEAEVARLRGANVEPPKKAFTYPEALEPREVDTPLEFPDAKAQPQTPEDLRRMLKEEDDARRKKK